MPEFFDTEIRSWNGFLKTINKLDDNWIFRGQPANKPLATSLERACDFFGILNEDRPNIENSMIRDFRRRYVGKDSDVVMDDTLYCLALIQHHGSPTRLLDWTYSAYIAAFFALESCDDECEIWCLNAKWCKKEAERIEPKIKKRKDDPMRNDNMFFPNFINTKYTKLFVHIINPFLLNQRLIIQQGAFMCPGNIREPLIENLKAFKGWGKKGNILRIHFKLSKEKRNDALLELNRMNINRASLFPGLDGFAQSLKQRIILYNRLDKIEAK